MIVVREHITLGQFLKNTNITSSGGEAKHYLIEHLVLVNGEKEERRGRKLYPGDQVTIDNQIYIIT
ncbi:MAG: S4 domain-containing protein YaaA [Peptococcaceae bacterium]|nr:S4 domain-containing protein YaaA [Peptococcaceae bacterium]